MTTLLANMADSPFAWLSLWIKWHGPHQIWINPVVFELLTLELSALGMFAAMWVIQRPAAPLK